MTLMSNCSFAPLKLQKVPLLCSTYMCLTGSANPDHLFNDTNEQLLKCNYEVTESTIAVFNIDLCFTGSANPNHLFNDTNEQIL